QGQDKIVRDSESALLGVQNHFARKDLLYCRVEVRSDLAVLDAIFDVRLDPILHLWRDARAAMHHGDSRAVAPEFQRGDGSRVFSANYQDVGGEVWMRLLVVMGDLGKILSGDIHVVRKVVITGCDNQLAGLKFTLLAKAVGRVDAELAVLAIDLSHRVILANFKFVVLSNTTVVLQSFLPVGLRIRTWEGDVADFEELRRGEERHVRRIVI